MNRCQIFLTFCLLLLLAGCAKVSTLNLRPHNYGKQPSNIVWFQVPGLTAEQISMLKFAKRDPSELIALEDFTCHANMWTYNLYDLRPVASHSLLSQMTGSKNIKGTCTDLPEKPFWDYFSEQGYSVGVYEHGASQKDSLHRSQACPEASSRWGENLSLWLTQKPESKDANYFHYQENENFNTPGIYYDRSCQEGENCYTGLYDNAVSIWRRFENDRGLNVYVIRDFSYLEALKEQNISLARERLAEIEKTLSLFMYTKEIGDESLLLLTSAGSQHIEMPSAGQQWADFEQRGQNVLFQRSSLMNMALARGARAENFCGVFNESEVLGRMLFTPDKNQLPQIIDLF